MTTTLTKDNLFKPAPSRAETKADITDRSARAIIEKETGDLKNKTERLRQARLEMEAQQKTKAPEAKPRRKKVAALRRGKSSM